MRQSTVSFCHLQSVGEKTRNGVVDHTCHAAMADSILNATATTESPVRPIPGHDWVAMFALLSSFVFLGYWMIKCMLRGMRGQFDLDVDIVRGDREPEHTLEFRNPFASQKRGSGTENLTNK